MTSTDYPPHGPEKTDRWYKCGQHVQAGGVCSGLGENLGIDRNVVRLLAVILFFLTGPLLIVAYFVAYFVLPWRPDTGPYRSRFLAVFAIAVLAIVAVLVTFTFVLPR